MPSMEHLWAERIFSRVILVWWPLDRIGLVGYDKTLTPPGPVECD